MSNDNVTPGPYQGEGVFCGIAASTVQNEAAAEVKGGIITVTMYNAVVGGGTGKGAVAADGTFSFDQPGGMGAPLTIDGHVNEDCTELVADVKNAGEVIFTLKGKAKPDATSMKDCGGAFSVE